MKLLKQTTVLLLVTLLLGAAGCASTGGFFSDAAITTKVKTAIYDEPTLKVMDIGVSTTDNVVTLSGTVASRTEQAKAIRVARGVDGVKSVKSQLVVKQ